MRLHHPAGTDHSPPFPAPCCGVESPCANAPASRRDRRLRRALKYAALLAFLAAAAWALFARTARGDSRNMSNVIQAPQLEKNLGWLNTDRPLRFREDLRGQVVLLDFWTYCCINCMHILPDLAYLEEKYKDQPFVVIGVHSAKFDNEAERRNIRAAMLRYEIKHPVVIDDKMNIWRKYGVRSWPTLALIDPVGNIVFGVAGEGNRDVLDQMIAEVLDEHRKLGTLAAAPLKLRREENVLPASGLAFPGKVIADPAGKRLFISDSNHNRIVVASLPDARGECKLIRTVGDGRVGRDDGPADKARFNHPQGMALYKNRLLVADTENHLIRSIDLATDEVTTFAGTGEMVYDRAGGNRGTEQGLNSPWDLAVDGATLYVAMAGMHQIWRFEIPTGLGRAYAGTGRENIVDGPVEKSALSQPSGLALHDNMLYIADSEVSAVRVIHIADEKITTLVGEGLFAFGDVDGPGDSARLQHCLGVSIHGDDVLIADTYNHKIKRLDPTTRTVTSLYGTGRAGAHTDDGRVQFFEPGGLHAADGVLYVADTNNHRVVRVDLKSGDWAEVMVEGLARPAGDTDRTAAATVPAQNIPAAGPVRLALNVELPAGAHLNPDAPRYVRITSGDDVLLQTTLNHPKMPIEVDCNPDGQRAGTWRVQLDSAYCAEGDAASCYPFSAAWELPVRAADGAPAAVALTARVQ